MEKTQNSTDNEMVIDLVQLAKALWHRAWAILLAMVIFGAAAFSYAYFLITPLYKASAMLYVNNSSLSVGSTKTAGEEKELFFRRFFFFSCNGSEVG